MAGDYQHYLQQMLQKGFKRPDGSRNHPSVWEYRKSESPTSFRRTEKLGAEDHFYSPNSQGLFKSLDDKITDWENRKQADVRRWRKFEDGQIVDPEKAASLVGLTGVRTRAVRDVFSNVMDRFLGEFHETVKNPDALFGHINEQSGKVAQRLNEEIKQHIGEVPIDPITGNPMNQEIASVSRMITYALAECFSLELAKAFREIGNLFSELFSDGPLDVAQIHNEALDSFFTKGAVRDDLLKLHWSVAVRQSGNSWVLPDCAILSIDGSGNASPFLFGDIKSRKSIILPLSPDRALVGQTDPDDILDLSNLDLHCAKCSSEFFISSQRSDRLTDICAYIGDGPQVEIDQGINIALSAVDPFRPTSSKEDQTFTFLESFTLSLHGLNVSYEDIESQVQSFGKIICRLSNRIHISRLTKIIICHSVPNALIDLKGIDIGEIGKEDFEGVFYQLPYEDDEFIGFELYVNVLAFEQVLDTESDEFDLLLNLLLQTLWQIHTRSILFNEAKNFIELNQMYQLPAQGPRVGNLAFDAAIKFTAIRHANLIEPLGEETCDHLRQNFSDALLNWQSAELPLAESQNQRDEQCAAIMLSCENLFIAAARYFGLCQAQNVDVFEDLEKDKQCTGRLKDMDLYDWIHRFDLDLRILFANLYAPFNCQKILELQPHIERLFWARGAIIFGHEDGGKILPFADRNIDYAKLTEEMNKFASGFIPENFSDLVKTSTLSALANR